MEFTYYSDMVPQKQYKTKEGIRGKNKNLLEKYEGSSDETEKKKIEESLIENNLPLVFAVTDWWYNHYKDEVRYEDIEDLRQDAVIALMNRIRSGGFSLRPKKFSVDLYFRISNVFYQRLKGNHCSVDALNRAVHDIDLDSFESGKEFSVNTDLDSFDLTFKDAMQISLSEREKIILQEVIFKETELEELGWMFGLTRERARQIYEKALRKFGHIKIGDNWISSIYLDLLKTYLG